MTWVVLIIGLAGTEPTFRGAYPTPAECHRTANHINATYHTMVHARCIRIDEARRLGYTK